MITIITLITHDNIIFIIFTPTFPKKMDLCNISFLYCFPYSYSSSNYCDSDSCCSFTLLKVLAKSKSTHNAIAFKSEKEQKFYLSSSLSPLRASKNETIVVAIVGRAITKGGAIEKSPILLLHITHNNIIFIIFTPAFPTNGS